MIPIVTLFEKGKLLQTTESKELIPGREISRIHLVDLLDVARATGSHRDPSWLDTINSLGNEMDDTIADAMGKQTLVDMLDLAQKKNRKKTLASGARDLHLAHENRPATYTTT
jgi:hypothetical protein